MNQSDKQGKEQKLQDECLHDFDTGSFGVLIGASCCKRCGHVATLQDFPATQRKWEAEQ